MSKTGTGPLQWFDVTLTLSASPAYASGDLLADVALLEDFFTPLQQTALVQSVHVLDEDDQAGALDVCFTNLSTSWGTINSTLALSDTVARGVQGLVKVVAGDYTDLGGAQLAVPQFNPFLVASDESASAKRLYVAVVSRDAKTYSVSGIRLRIGVLR